MDTPPPGSLSQREAGRVPITREATVRRNSERRAGRTRKEGARIRTEKGWQEIPQESWLDDLNSRTQAISEQQGYNR